MRGIQESGPLNGKLLKYKLPVYFGNFLAKCYDSLDISKGGSKRQYHLFENVAHRCIFTSASAEVCNLSTSNLPVVVERKPIIFAPSFQACVVKTNKGLP